MKSLKNLNEHRFKNILLQIFNCNNVEKKADGFYLFIKLSALVCVYMWLTTPVFAQIKAVWVRPFIGADAETRKNPMNGR